MHDYAAMLTFIDLWHHSCNNCCLVAAAAGVGLPLTTAGWCPTTRTCPCSSTATSTWRSAPPSRLSNTSTNTSTRATTVHRWTLAWWTLLHLMALRPLSHACEMRSRSTKMAGMCRLLRPATVYMALICTRNTPMSFGLLCIWKGVRPSYFKRALMLRPYLIGTFTQFWLHGLHLTKQHGSISIHLHHCTWLSTRFTMTFHALPHGKRRKSNGHSAHRRQVCCLSAACTLCNPPRGRGTLASFAASRA